MLNEQVQVQTVVYSNFCCVFFFLWTLEVFCWCYSLSLSLLLFNHTEVWPHMTHRGRRKCKNNTFGHIQPASKRLRVFIHTSMLMESLSKIVLSVLMSTVGQDVHFLVAVSTTFLAMSHFLCYLFSSVCWWHIVVCCLLVRRTNAGKSHRRKQAT